MTITSLFSSSSSAATAYGYGSSSVNPTTQAILDAVAKATGTATTTSTTSSNGVSISTNAKLAAANAADNAKTFSALTTDVRKSLDAGNTDMTEMSGRALSAIILNRDGNFSRSESAAAKAELNGRSRQDFTALMGGSSSLGGLSAYNQQVVSQYDAMSDEEREARGWTPQMRSSAEAFVQTTQSTSSLFDQINADDSTDSATNNPFSY